VRLRRKPCARCGGEKGPGKRRRYCDACAPLAAEERREKAAERARRWYAEHPEQAAVTRAASAETYPDDGRERGRRWRETHPEQAATHSYDRKARLRIERAGGVYVERVARLVVLELHDGVCGVCGEDVDPFDYHVDHVDPISEGGEHSYANTQPTHPACNRRKNNEGRRGADGRFEKAVV
jgi:5-methylcytosine-specific restriction endonuclease McrA